MVVRLANKAIKRPEPLRLYVHTNKSFPILFIVSDLVFVIVEFFARLQLLANLKRLNMEHQFRIE